MSIKSLKSLLIVGAAVSSILLTPYVSAAGPVNTKSNFGSQAANADAEYAVKIVDSTKWVNVHDGDTVRFSVNGKDFTWHFDTLENFSIVKLSDIAPAGANAGSARVYVALNPVYKN